MPPDRRKFKADFYKMAGGLAIMGADIYPMILTRHASLSEKIPVMAVFGLGMITGLWGAGNMSREDYELEDQQLTIFDEQSNQQLG